MLSGANPLTDLDDGDEAARAEVDKEEGETLRTLAGANTNPCFVPVVFQFEVSVSVDGFSFSCCGSRFTVSVGHFVNEKKEVKKEPGCASDNNNRQTDFRERNNGTKGGGGDGA